MAQINFQDLSKQLKSGKYPAVLLMHGEEAFFTDQITHWIEHEAISEAQKGFNQTVMYGRDVDAVTIVNAARRFPMMAEHQLVLVKEAQNLGDKELEKLTAYFEKPLTSTFLVMAFKGKTLDKRKKNYKLADEKGLIFLSEKVKDYQLAKWIEQYISQQGFKVSVETATIMSEYLGNNLSRIASEIEKLAINLQAGAAITVELIEKYIGISRDFNVFELQNAIGRRDSLKAFQIVSYFAESPKASNFSMPVAIGSLYSFFSRIYNFHFHKGMQPQQIAAALGVNPYFLKDYELYAKNFSLPRTKKSIGLLLEYDLKAKGLGNTETSDGELLKEMVYKLMA
ncbi:MAG: DNA polymerase III subunit delta [Bacteroidia bacterium]|jgi:DNA polymerase III subunit delta